MSQREERKWTSSFCGLMVVMVQFDLSISKVDIGIWSVGKAKTAKVLNTALGLLCSTKIKHLVFQNIKRITWNLVRGLYNVVSTMPEVILEGKCLMVYTCSTCAFPKQAKIISLSAHTHLSFHSSDFFLHFCSKSRER